MSEKGLLNQQIGDLKENKEMSPEVQAMMRENTLKIEGLQVSLELAELKHGLRFIVKEAEESLTLTISALIDAVGMCEEQHLLTYLFGINTVPEAAHELERLLNKYGVMLFRLTVESYFREQLKLKQADKAIKEKR